MSKPIVFLGPSLPRAQAEQILDADYRAPAGQGDLMRALASDPPAIALIDGVFKDAPTVRHREILWAMGQGVAVFGSSSMGALRAAELHGAGMIGHGLIYRWYRRYPLLADDAVAVTHSPAALGAQPLSDALVDIRRSLVAARRQGLIDAATAQRDCKRLVALPFAQRHLPAAAAPARIRQKAQDARGLLRRLAKHAETGVWPSLKPHRVPVVHAWLDDLRDSGISLDLGEGQRR